MRSGFFFQKEQISVPRVPSPSIGAVHIMRAERVRPIDTSFSQAVRELSRRRWRSGGVFCTVFTPPDRPVDHPQENDAWETRVRVCISP